MTRQRNIIGEPAIDRIGEGSVALKRLVEIEAAVDVPPEGFHFSEGERQFVRDIRRRYNATREFTAEQRDRIRKLWELVRKGRRN